MLEGITKAVMPEEVERLSLAGMLEVFPEHVDLEQPIMELTDAIRKGRNIAAHFDEHIEPDQEITEMMIDLPDYLVEYLFVLPARINMLHNRLAAVEDTSLPESLTAKEE